jgi:hypothetical protein
VDDQEAYLVQRVIEYFQKYNEIHDFKVEDN